MSSKKGNGSKQVLCGTIHMHHKGFGFVTPDEKTQYDKDIFIPKDYTLGAVDGDYVECELDPIVSAKGPEGRVLEILKRSRTHIVATLIEGNSKRKFLNAISPVLGRDKAIQIKNDPEYSLNFGDRIYAKVTEWDHETILCKPVENLGNVKDASRDVPVAMKEFNIPAEFSEEVIQEAKAFGDKVSEEDLKGRESLLSLECFTIDPTTAKDFDDALSLTLDQEVYHLGVHIADVSFYVRPGSQLDQEASKRGNSTYFPGTCIPMLPEALSNHLCSLKEKEIRLTASVFMDFNQAGDLLSARVSKTYIESQKRFTYEEAKKILDGKKKSKHLDTLKLMTNLCALLKKKRCERGSVDLALPDVELLIDEQGMPYGHQVIEYDVTHQLVEEFMLKANEIVAQHLLKNGDKGIFRIHQQPTEEQLAAFYELARSLGFSLPAKPTIQDVQALFEKVKTTPHLYHVAVGFIRSMKLAIYSHQNVGHYGLALEQYCHFTSPIRRYSDLIAHRLLFKEHIPEDLETVARVCSEKERISFRAESSAMNLKKLRYLQVLDVKNPDHFYDAFISKVKPFGIFFELTDFMFEGFIHISQLGNDYFEFDPETQCLVGTGSGKTFKNGIAISVHLENVDLIHSESQWRLAKSKRSKKNTK